MIRSFSKYIDKIGERPIVVETGVSQKQEIITKHVKEVVFSTNQAKEVVFSTTNSDFFSEDLSVSLPGGKTFGKYKNGDLIPASGKTVKDIIKMALSEAVDEADKYSASNFIFDKNQSIELINSQLSSLSNDPSDYVNKKGQLEVPVGFKRLNSFPLDSSSVFQTLSGLQSYVQTNPSAYYGQICSVIETDSAYIIKGDGSLKQLGFNASASLDSLVYATGNQIISGLKTFSEGINVSGSAFFAQKPQVNGTGVLLSGEAATWDGLAGYPTWTEASSTYVNWGTFSNYTGQKNRKFSLSLPTGISSIDIDFPMNFSSVPSVYCSIDGESDIIYQTLIKNKTTSGCSVYFSDHIQEPNFNLNVTASINTD
jgi:hypothetical protein